MKTILSLVCVHRCFEYKQKVCTTQGRSPVPRTLRASLEPFHAKNTFTYAYAQTYCYTCSHFHAGTNTINISKMLDLSFLEYVTLTGPQVHCCSSLPRENKSHCQITKTTWGTEQTGKNVDPASTFSLNICRMCLNEPTHRDPPLFKIHCLRP